ncbi:MAG: FAD-binding oxidoreductase [Myxococcota bacterium]
MRSRAFHSVDTGPTLTGWGRLPAPGREVRGEDLLALAEGAALSRGLGRSYGDASLPPSDRPVALNTTLADRILSFDEGTGLLRAEAGLSLLEMNRLFIPRGWFTPVTPGTQFVTLGGMVAADVHGKGQHVQGDFGDHVTRLRMRVADGRALWCSRDEHADLFRATIGGMGLTGHVLEVEVRMRRIPSPWIVQESRRIDDVDAFQDALEEAATRWPYTVGWIDCASRGARMGRGILMCGRWAEPGEAPARPPRRLPAPRVPFDFPSWALNRWTIRAFNEAYYWKHLPRERTGIVDWRTFFYPLDSVREWNRIYGKRGFTQYQCVLPREAGRGSARRVLEELTQRGGGSFLSVIKDFGREGPGVLSFPRPGITLNLDLPVRDDTQALTDALNERVLADGGRIYLAKDAFTRPEHFRAMEGARLDELARIRDRWDPQRRFRSALSVRLLGD